MINWREVLLIALGRGTVDRIGVDVDEHDGLRGLITALRCRSFGDVTQYYTRHGFHFEVELYERVDYSGALNIRRLLGDCPDRLAVDERRLIEPDGDLRRWDTLFSVRYKNGETYIRREIGALACGPYPVQEIDDAYLDCPEAGRQGQEVYSN